MPCSSSGQSQSGQRGGSSYTSTVRSQYGQSPSRIAGGCSVSFGIGIALGGSGPLLHRQYPAYLESGRRRLHRRDRRASGRPRTCSDPPLREGRCGGVPRAGLGGFHLLATATLAARDVGVDRFVLPAVVPFVVDRKLGRAPRSRATAIGLVPLVGPRERPDRLAPETLLRHLVHVPSSLSPEDGSGAALVVSFERWEGPVHSALVGPPRAPRSIRTPRPDRGQDASSCPGTQVGASR